MSGFEIPKLNFFQQPVQQIGAVGAGSARAAGGQQKTGGVATPYEKDMADFRQYLPAYNGTGELRPKTDAAMDFLA